MSIHDLDRIDPPEVFELNPEEAAMVYEVLGSLTVDDLTDSLFWALSKFLKEHPHLEGAYRFEMRVVENG